MKVYPQSDTTGKRAGLNTRILLKCQDVCETARELKAVFPHETEVEALRQLADATMRQAKLVAGRGLEG